jgi:hypothetical protein
VNFEAYLISKKIDPAAFEKAEPQLWKTWNYEFENIHPNSFTAQKLYLINPIRRKYPLKSELVKGLEQTVSITQETSSAENKPAENKTSGPPTSSPKPYIPKPVFKPKPKIS